MTTLPQPNATARELLAHIAGDAHRDHTVVGKTRAGKTFGVICSCGSSFSTLITTESAAALRNVTEEPQ